MLNARVLSGVPLHALDARECILISIFGGLPSSTPGNGDGVIIPAGANLSPLGELDPIGPSVINDALSFGTGTDSRVGNWVGGGS